MRDPTQADKTRCPRHQSGTPWTTPAPKGVPKRPAAPSPTGSGEEVTHGPPPGSGPFAGVPPHDRLARTQRAEMGRILAELQQEGRKGDHSHWAWWVFPTEIVGKNDPAATCVTATTAEWLVAQDDGTWRQVLEKVCDLVEADGPRALPDRDHGRVHHFIRFWSGMQGTPPWMQRVCRRLV